MSSHIKQYHVYWQDQLVLDVRDQPGMLISTSAPPPRPGQTPPAHPFLSGSAYVPEHEGKLRDALDASSSTVEFLERLRDLGYIVEEDKRS
jgi:hypothetical protein